ncbi:MAG TPA: hypothetical protein PKE45_07305, partial [Caldilineaceae bacterium]|nr:hypothetical protein [Caldilineaceae bacterium]
QQARQIEELHRGAILKAELLRVNNALMRLTELVYLESADGERDNIDPATGRILIAKPWGSAGREYFGLSRRTADILRCCLLHKRPSKRPVLYFYDKGSKDWYADLANYPTLAAAMFWVKHEQIDLAEWRQAGNEVRKQAATRRQ